MNVTFGMADELGKVLVPPRFAWVTPYSTSQAIVETHVPEPPLVWGKNKEKAKKQPKPSDPKTIKLYDFATGALTPVPWVKGVTTSMSEAGRRTVFLTSLGQKVVLNDRNGNLLGESEGGAWVHRNVILLRRQKPADAHPLAENDFSDLKGGFVDIVRRSDGAVMTRSRHVAVVKGFPYLVNGRVDDLVMEYPWLLAPMNDDGLPMSLPPSTVGFVYLHSKKYRAGFGAIKMVDAGFAAVRNMSNQIALEPMDHDWPETYIHQIGSDRSILLPELTMTKLYPAADDMVLAGRLADGSGWAALNHKEDLYDTRNGSRALLMRYFPYRNADLAGLVTMIREDNSNRWVERERALAEDRAKRLKADFDSEGAAIYNRVRNTGRVRLSVTDIESGQFSKNRMMCTNAFKYKSLYKVEEQAVIDANCPQLGAMDAFERQYQNQKDWEQKQQWAAQSAARYAIVPVNNDPLISVTTTYQGHSVTSTMRKSQAQAIYGSQKVP